jgi:hypothetical protein
MLKGSARDGAIGAGRLFGIFIEDRCAQRQSAALASAIFGSVWVFELLSRVFDGRDSKSSKRSHRHAK